jgi:23S rRNA G2069 N7-methylase RlmK/C1962 C5-methylase RlmI
MNAYAGLVSMALILSGCGEAVSIDADERKAEDVRREAVRNADDADTVKVREAANEAYARDRSATDAASGQAPATRNR